VPNRYPALRVEGELSPRPDGIFDVMNGIGAHEVIVDTPVHSVQPHRYSDSDWARIVRVLQSRSLDLRRDIRLACLTIFKNHGSQAGATLSHPHTQIIATPVVPALIASEMMEISRYVAFRQRCPLCDMIVQETANGVRVVSANASFTVVAPFASRVPFELLVIPVRHSPDFDSISGDEVRDLGQILAGVFRQLAAAIGETAFNLVVHTAPLRNQGGSAAAQQDYHWHVEILPWVSGPAGFDACTGLFINTVAPEEAARYLRQLAERTER